MRASGLAARARARISDVASETARALVKFSRTPADPTRPAPAFGEHTEEVLREAGYSPEEVEAMLESGAAAGPNAGAAPTEFRA